MLGASRLRKVFVWVGLKRTEPQQAFWEASVHISHGNLCGTVRADALRALRLHSMPRSPSS
jgi:hypothetical protein